MFSQTVRPTKLENRDRHPTLLLPPGLQTLYSLLLQCSGCKNKVDLVKVFIISRRRRAVKQFADKDNSNRTFGPYPSLPTFL